MSTDSHALQNTAQAADGTPNDMASLLLKMKQQQDTIEQLQRQNKEKDDRLTQATAAKRKEMQALMDGMKQYLGAMKENIPEAEIEKVVTGLEACVETGERNPIFEVMCCASNKDKLRVDELERMRTENEELKKGMQGGIFGNESARVGEKRNASEITPASNDNFWQTFELGMK